MRRVPVPALPSAGAHCVGIGCQHDGASAVFIPPAPTPSSTLRPRRTRGGRHERLLPGALPRLDLAVGEGRRRANG